MSPWNIKGYFTQMCKEGKHLRNDKKQILQERRCVL